MCVFMQDLCDKLWDICDVRKSEWEAEQGRITNERWLEDHLGLITNTYISIMQVYPLYCTSCLWRVVAMY